MTTGNEERDAMLRRAIGECLAVNEPPNFGLIVDHLPADFGLGEDELADALAEMKHDHGGVIEPPRENATEQPHEDAANSAGEPDLTREHSQRAVEAAHTRLSNARVAVRILQDKHAQSKGALAGAILAWQQQTDDLTPDQRREREVRNHLAGCAADRAARRAPSQAAAFVRKRFQNGGNARGAFDRRFLKLDNTDPRRGPVAKVPSER